MGAWYTLFQCDFVLFVCMLTFLKPQGEQNISWGGGGVHLCLGKNTISSRHKWP